MTRPPFFVAEVKPCSPFGFKSPLSTMDLFRIARRHGDMISIHTNEQWGGSLQWLKTARAMTEKPILAKGIHKTDDEIQQALDCGADRVLVVGRIPADKYLDQIWYEPASLKDLADLSDAARTGLKIVWNQRDLTTGKPKSMYLNGTVNTAGEIFRGARSRGMWICQASYIWKPKDVNPDARAFIIGEHLPEFVKELW